ncbi:MAG: hypothetical protein ABRQ37_15050 [Candidatus Eremiobacterota bacterium]
MPYSWDDDHDFTGDDGFSFQDARKSYDNLPLTKKSKTGSTISGRKKSKTAGVPSLPPKARTYDDVAVAKSESQVFYTYKSNFLKTDALYPVIIGIDTTGSMAEWPKVFFDKLPLLYREGVKYFPDCEISFQAINDFEADGKDVAFQPAPFGKGSHLDEIIGKLLPYGGGGGQVTESYEIFAAYNSFLEAPKAIIKPLAIILGDEKPFPYVPDEVCKYYEMGNTSTEEAFKRLHSKCDVFLVRKLYNNSIKEDKSIIDCWKKTALIKSERILHIEDPKRVVDVILGILGIVTGKTGLFEKELVERQEPSQVKEVLTSIHRLKTSYHKDLSQKSVTSVTGKGNKSKGLTIDE